MTLQVSYWQYPSRCVTNMGLCTPLALWLHAVGVQRVSNHILGVHYHPVRLCDTCIVMEDYIISQRVCTRITACVLPSSTSWCHPYPSDMMTSSNGNIFRVTGPLCREFTGPGEFPAQRPVTRSFGVFFDLRLNKRLSKQSRGWWFEPPPWSLWRQCNELHQW